MALILNIDTAMETAHVSIAKDGKLLQHLFNADQKEHGSFLQPAIKELLHSEDISLEEIDAVAITQGPGSYTGLRVAMATAKGLCYALNKPLITINTLEALAASALADFQPDTSTLLCPMIDARRMEVYTALYDIDLNILFDPCALIIAADSFNKYFLNNKIAFFGSGAKKWGELCKDPNSLIIQKVEINSVILNNLSFTKYLKKEFADIAYTEPVYLKEFFTNAKLKA